MRYAHTPTHDIWSLPTGCATRRPVRENASSQTGRHAYLGYFLVAKHFPLLYWCQDTDENKHSFGERRRHTKTL